QLSWRFRGWGPGVRPPNQRPGARACDAAARALPRLRGPVPEAGTMARRMEMAGRLEGRKVASLVRDGFEKVEMTEPRRALDEAGAETVLVSPKDGRVKGWRHTDWGDEFPVDRPLASARADDFDALLLPGGGVKPDHLRQDPQAVSFVRGFFEEKKPVAAICHGPWMLAEADVIEGRKGTSWPSIQADLKNAGAEWVDQEVVTDQGLVTSRKPDDIPAFNRKMVEEFAEGRHPSRLRSFTPGTGTGKPGSVK